MHAAACYSSVAYYHEYGDTAALTPQFRSYFYIDILYSASVWMRLLVCASVLEWLQRLTVLMIIQIGKAVMEITMIECRNILQNYYILKWRMSILFHIIYVFLSVN